MRILSRTSWKNVFGRAATVCWGLIVGLSFGVLAVYLFFALVMAQWCTSSSELAGRRAGLSAVANDPSVSDQTRAEARGYIAQIDAAVAAAEQQAAEEGQLASSATMLVPGGVAFAGLVGVGVRLASRERALRAIVSAIDAQLEANPQLAAEWTKSKAALRSAMGEQATAVVKRIKARRKKVKAS